MIKCGWCGRSFDRKEFEIHRVTHILKPDGKPILVAKHVARCKKQTEQPERILTPRQ